MVATSGCVMNLSQLYFHCHQPAAPSERGRQPLESLALASNTDPSASIWPQAR